MGAWAMAVWLACAYGLGIGFGMDYIFIYRVWPKGRFSYMVWAWGYLWLVGKVIALSYIGMVIGVIGKYV